MKPKFLAIFAAVFLFATPVLAGDLGHLTVRDWITQYSVTYNHDLVFLTGEIDELLISAPNDLVTVGAVGSVLRNRLRDGIIKFDDPMWR